MHRIYITMEKSFAKCAPEHCFVRIVEFVSVIIAFQVQADITSGDLTICFVRVVEFGSNFPCGDTDKEEVKTYAADDFTVTSAVLETGPVTNIGRLYEHSAILACNQLVPSLIQVGCVNTQQYWLVTNWSRH